MTRGSHPALHDRIRCPLCKSNVLSAFLPAISEVGKASTDFLPIQLMAQRVPFRHVLSLSPGRANQLFVPGKGAQPSPLPFTIGQPDDFSWQPGRIEWAKGATGFLLAANCRFSWPFRRRALDGCKACPPPHVIDTPSPGCQSAQDNGRCKIGRLSHRNPPHSSLRRFRAKEMFMVWRTAVLETARFSCWVHGQLQGELR